jgi:hypothetical protein
MAASFYSAEHQAWACPGRERPRFKGEDVLIRRKSFLALGGLAATTTLLAACGEKKNNTKNNK